MDKAFLRRGLDKLREQFAGARGPFARTRKALRNIMPPSPEKKVFFALQGGGAHGSYTKGVLKALFSHQAFREPDLQVAGVSGTSAGAMNATLLTAGLNDGGPDKAMALLDSYWSAVSDTGRLNSLFSAFYETVQGNWPNLPDSLTRAYKFLPSGFVPMQLRNMIDKHVPDWKKVQSGPVKLFVNAVEENSKGERSHVVFSGTEVTADSVAASGALEMFGPHIFRGNKYFDGAYWQNPSLDEALKEEITDLIIITLKPVPAGGIKPEHQDDARARHEAPGKELLGPEIHNHIAWIAKQRPDINLHVISLNPEPHWDDSSRVNTAPKWLARLEQMGYEDGQAWLARHADSLGKRSSYERPVPPQSQSGPSGPG